MKVKIIETGEILELSAIDAQTGCDYTKDLIGNTGALTNGQFQQIEDTGIYTCSQGEYDWWTGVIDDYNAASQSVSEAKALGIWSDDDYTNYHDIECNDMEVHAAACRQYAEGVLARG